MKDNKATTNYILLDEYIKSNANSTTTPLQALFNGLNVINESKCFDISIESADDQRQMAWN